MHYDLLQNKTSIKITDEKYLKKAHEQILACLEEVFPPDYDFSNLQKFFQQDRQLTLPEISLGLIQYLVQAIKNNFIHINVYRMLQQQTQKLEGSIRKHLKIQQQMKIYIQYLETHNGKSNKNEKQQKINDDIRQYIENTKKEKQQLLNHIAKLKQQNSIIIKQIEKKNKQIDHYSSILKTRKKTNQTSIGNSFIDYNTNTVRDQQPKLNTDGHMKKIKYSFINHGKTIDFNKNKQNVDFDMINGKQTIKYLPINGRKTQRDRPNSQSKLFGFKHPQNSSMNTTFEYSQHHRKNNKLSFSNEKSAKNYAVKIHKLQQQGSVDNHHVKKRWQNSQLFPSKQKYNASENFLQQNADYQQNLIYYPKGNTNPLQTYNYQRTRGSDQQSSRNASSQMHFLKNNKKNNADNGLKNYSFKTQNN